MKYTKLILDERMIVPEPKIRLEFFLHAIVTGETCELVPKTVDEEYLYAIATSDTSRMSEIYPRTLVEIYYDAILNNSVEDLPTPRTRWEEFLRSAVTKEPCELEPETSLEIYLSQISSNGGFDYIVSTSTNSTIISLPNSINGTIKSIEMDGNTLVNYCTNGNEELTLNNEINAQGTDVTLADTVDNSKVDVMCEGNTLVNIVEGKWYNGISEIKNNIECFKIEANQSVSHHNIANIKSGVPYTLIYNYMSTELVNGNNAFGRLHLTLSNNGAWAYDVPVKNFISNQSNFITSVSVFTIPTHIQFSTLAIMGVLRNIEGTVWLDKNVLLLEGDYTNKPIPSYFEGMKSVGECEDNKIEILSSSINTNGLSTYIDCSKHKSGDTVLVDLSGNGNDFILNKPSEFNNGALILDGSNYATLSNSDVFKAKNTGTFMKFKVKNDSPTYSHLLCKQTNAITLDGSNRFRLYPIREYDTTIPALNREVEHTLYVGDNFVMVDGVFYDKNYVNIQDGGNLTYLGSYIGRENLIGEIYCLLIYNRNLSKEEVGALNSSFAYNSNKKEIQLSEPLRGLPNGVCDKFVKQGGKWYVERNCGEYTFTGNEELFHDISISSSYHFYTSSIVNKLSYNHENGYLCNTLKTMTYYFSDGYSGKNIGSNFASGFNFAIGKNEFGEDKTISEVNILFKQWLSENPTTVVYQLATPTYEEITDPQVITYLDTTHISTNSIIPCNMQVKNSGYNAIIKPSTKYTVAFDTNASGEVNIALGGTKTSTTNGVATITTPSTLTDDSLRLYGKGIKASNVMLLEGDKTNYIPSFFEGMKSSFELEDNNVEIVSQNKNLINNSHLINKESWIKGTYWSYPIKVKPNTTYSYSMLINCTTPIWVGFFGEPGNYIDPIRTVIWNHFEENKLFSDTFNTGQRDTIYLSFYSNNMENDFDTYVSKYVTNIQLEEGSQTTSYVPYKSNSIQLQLNEPLRKWDKFVFKNGQLMIERGSKVFVLDGNTNGITYMRGYDGAKDTDTNMLFSLRASKEVLPIAEKDGECSSGICNILPNIYTADVSTEDVPIGFSLRPYHSQNNYYINIRMNKNRMISNDIDGIKDWLNKNNLIIEFPIIEPIYEEVPTSQELVCYENATLFIDTNITPTHVEIEYPTEKQQLFRIK